MPHPNITFSHRLPGIGIQRQHALPEAVAIQRFVRCVGRLG
jgi:hypothetical protein